MINQDVLYWIWLSQKFGVASKQFDRLIEKYDNPFEVYRLENDEIEQFEDFSSELRAKLCEKDLDSSYEILKYCKSNKVDVIAYTDKRYPQRLKQTVDPPILLYCKGHFPDFDAKLCIGVVGTRKMSAYGRESAYKIAYELGAADAYVVSGMALGIDGVAACGALSGGGRTVAVLGCGLDTVYPKQHRLLMEEIARHGAVITEYPPKEPPHGYNFPKRNRIISGLCQGVFVVEANEGSGALITAQRAIEQGRELFALPGKISDEGAKGPNALIRDGAYPALCADDILKHYGFLYGDTLDRKRFEKAKKSKKSSEESLRRYQMLYAIGDEDEKEEILTPKKKCKESSKKQESVMTSTEKKAESYEGDSTTSLADTLDATTKRIFECIPQDKAISADAIILDGVSVADIITALTLLELYGLVSSLPGGLYIRK